jgi:hypothetical protein
VCVCVRACVCDESYRPTNNRCVWRTSMVAEVLPHLVHLCSVCSKSNAWNLPFAPRNLYEAVSVTETLSSALILRTKRIVRQIGIPVYLMEAMSPCK